MTQPSIAANFDRTRDTIEVSYQLKNTLQTPIFVFDQMWRQPNGTYAPERAYVSIERGIATLSRRIWPLPRGLRHENPEVPYARRVEAGAEVQGRMVLSLPLIDDYPYGRIVHRREPSFSVSISEIRIEIGWGHSQNLEGGSVVDVSGVKLTLFPYHPSIGSQSVVQTPVHTIKLEGRAWIGQ